MFTFVRSSNSCAILTKKNPAYFILANSYIFSLRLTCFTQLNILPCWEKMKLNTAHVYIAWRHWGILRWKWHGSHFPKFSNWTWHSFRPLGVNAHRSQSSSSNWQLTSRVPVAPGNQSVQLEGFFPAASVWPLCPHSHREQHPHLGAHFQFLKIYVTGA